MPIEIFELVIKATVNEEGDRNEENATMRASPSNERNTERKRQQELADQINGLINRKKER